MNVPAELRYSTDHEWVRAWSDDDGRVIATIGITDYAQDALGDIVFVQLPAIDAVVTASSSFSEIESTKSVSDVYAPVGGVIVDVNDLLRAEPEKLNTDPYGTGWICAIHVADTSQLESLMTAEEYTRFVGN